MRWRAQQCAPYEIKTMSEILSEFSDGMIIPEGELPLYVATNESRLNGAGVLSYPGFMEAAADRLNGSFYILPSSVHEVILLPENSAFSVQELQAMVQDINAAEVSPEERLAIMHIITTVKNGYLNLRISTKPENRTKPLGKIGAVLLYWKCCMNTRKNVLKNPARWLRPIIGRMHPVRRRWSKWLFSG